MKRSTFRRRHPTPDNSGYHLHKEYRRLQEQPEHKPTAADVERLKESRRVHQAKADRRSAVWNGAR